MGKPRRFSNYDDDVAKARALVEAYGQARQDKSGVRSSFRDSPLGIPQGQGGPKRDETKVSLQFGGFLQAPLGFAGEAHAIDLSNQLDISLNAAATRVNIRGVVFVSSATATTLDEIINGRIHPQQILILTGINGQSDITITHASGNAGQILCPNDSDLTLSNDETAILMDDSTAGIQSWRVIGGSAVSGGGAGDNLGNHIATQPLEMRGNDIFLDPAPSNDRFDLSTDNEVSLILNANPSVRFRQTRWDFGDTAAGAFANFVIGSSFSGVGGAPAQLVAQGQDIAAAVQNYVAERYIVDDNNAVTPSGRWRLDILEDGTLESTIDVAGGAEVIRMRRYDVDMFNNNLERVGGIIFTPFAGDTAAFTPLADRLELSVPLGDTFRVQEVSTDLMVVSASDTTFHHAVLPSIDATFDFGSLLFSWDTGHFGRIELNDVKASPINTSNNLIQRGANSIQFNLDAVNDIYQFFFDGTARLSFSNTTIASAQNMILGDGVTGGVLSFNDTAVPAGSTVGQFFSGGNFTFNTPPFTLFRWTVDGLSQMRLDAAQLALEANNLIECGNIFPDTANTSLVGQESNRFNSMFANDFKRTADMGIEMTAALMDVFASNGSDDLRLRAGNNVDLGGGGGLADFRIDRDGTTPRLLLNNGGNILMTGISDHGFIQMNEITDPAAPGANNGIIYMKDNGAGKTQFVVRFPTGAVQVIATEP